MIWLAVARIRLGCWLMGGDFTGAIALYQLIAQRARAAISRDGRVRLDQCPALADALYEQVPGDWILTLTRRTDAV